MTQYSNEHFSEPIRSMSDGAMRRIKAIQGNKQTPSEIESMRPGDEYFSAYTRKETPAYIETTIQTTTRAFIHDSLPDTLIQGDTLTGPFAGMLSGMVLTIADEHDMTQTGQASALSFDAAGAERRLNEAWLLSTAQRQERGSFRLFSLHLGVTALVSIVLSFDDGQQVWRLGIEHQGVTHSYPRTNPATGDVELVEYVTERDD